MSKKRETQEATERPPGPDDAPGNQARTEVHSHEAWRTQLELAAAARGFGLSRYIRQAVIELMRREGFWPP